MEENIASSKGDHQPLLQVTRKKATAITTVKPTFLVNYGGGVRGPAVREHFLEAEHCSCISCNSHVILTTAQGGLCSKYLMVLRRNLQFRG